MLVFFLSQKVSCIHEREGVQQDFETVNVLVRDGRFALEVHQVKDWFKQMPREFEWQLHNLHDNLPYLFNCHFVGVINLHHLFDFLCIVLNLLLTLFADRQLHVIKRHFWVDRLPSYHHLHRFELTKEGMFFLLLRLLKADLDVGRSQWQWTEFGDQISVGTVELCLGDRALGVVGELVVLDVQHVEAALGVREQILDDWVEALITQPVVRHIKGLWVDKLEQKGLEKRRHYVLDVCAISDQIVGQVDCL